MQAIKKIGLILSLGAALVSSAALAQQQQFVNVLTGGQSGVYYPLGVALSQIYAKNIPNVRSTAQVTRASAENMNLLQAGRGELALALADSVSDAYKGNAEAGFPKPLTKLRGLSATYNNYIQIVANADSGMFLATIPAQIEPWFIVVTCLGSIAFCLLAALPPAWLASRVDPAVALRD